MINFFSFFFKFWKKLKGGLVSNNFLHALQESIVRIREFRGSLLKLGNPANPYP